MPPSARYRSMRYFLDGTWAAICSTVSSLGPRRNATHLPCRFNCKPCLTSDAMPKRARAKRLTWRLPRAAGKKRSRRGCWRVGGRLETRRRRRTVALPPARARPRPAAQENGRFAAGPGPTTAAQATARGNYVRRLREDSAHLASIAEDHRTTALAAALAAESAAQADHEAARKSREAVAKLKERAEAESARKAERRADESAADLAQAAHFRRKLE